MSVEEYDLVILGSGTGSKLAAWTFAAQGQRVAVVGRKYVGGSCPNIACLPSKNIIHSAKIASYIRRSKEFGISLDGFTIDMSGVRDRKRKKRTFRALWIQRLNAAVRPFGMTYSVFINGLSKSGITVDRKVLSDLAIHEPATFQAIAEKAKAALAA